MLRFDRHVELVPHGLVALSSDSGRLGDDLITDTAVQTVAMTLTHELAYSELLFGSLDGGVSWQELGDYLVGKALNWNVTLPSSGTLQLMLEDGAGNQAVFVNHDYRVDTTAPTAAVTAIALSTPVTDWLEGAPRHIVDTLSAPLAADELLYVSADGGTSWQMISDAVSGTELHWSSSYLTVVGAALQFQVVDAAGNQSVVAHFDYPSATTPDTTAVVFDLVNGVSSSHSGRSFESAVEYTIYIVLDSDQSTLNTSGASWGSGSGGGNLGANDTVIIVGDTGAIDIVDSYAFAGLADGDELFAETAQLGLKVGSGSFAEHLLLTANGLLTRRMAYTSVVSAQLWSGQAVFATPVAAGQYLSAIPDGLLTSQGLS